METKATSSKRRNKSKNGSTAIAYLRKSTDSKQENSLSVQLDGITKFAEANGIAILGVFSDAGVSGTAQLSECVGLQAAIKAVSDTGSKYLLAHRQDRVSRTNERFYLVKAQLAAIQAELCITDDGKLPNQYDEYAILKEAFTNIQSQMTVVLLRKRTSEALKYRRANNKKYTRISPYGYSWNGNAMVENDSEQEAIKKILSLASEGMSTPKISKALASQGMLARTGNPLSPQAVWNVIHRKKVAA